MTMLDMFLERQSRRKFGLPKNNIKLWTNVATVIFFGLVASICGVGLLFAWYAKDLPRPDKVQRVEGLSTVVLDRNGESIYDIYQEANRKPVPFSDVPEYLREATVAIEDKQFYQHQGLSLPGIARAVVNIFVFHNFQGGSTLTQQLVKTVLLTQERTLPRKIKEAILAIQIERKYSKDEILQMYLNEVPYGGATAGVEAAAQYYFGKHVKELDLIESAILAGMPQSPSRYSPFGQDSTAYIWRTEQVLRRMREDGYITAGQEDSVKAQLASVQFTKGDDGLKAPHFVAYVQELLAEKLGKKMVADGGLKVTTTLDVKLQEKAQAIVREEVDKAKKLKVSNGAAVVLDPKTGEILAMVGSKDYLASESGGFKFNVVTQGLRQPGSTLKPITYAAAFKKGYTPATLLLDVDTKYPSGDSKKPEYNPKNYDGKYRGPLQLRFALGNSINTIAVKVNALVGVKEVLKLANEMGLSTLAPTNENINRIGLSLTLGGGEVKLLELASAFGVFAQAGLRQEPVAILKVEDSSGKVIFEHKPVNGKQALSAEIAFLINSILSDNDARKEIFGTRSLLVVSGKTVAVKTGTTDDKRDNWTVGYTPSVVVGAWVGNNDNTPMNPALASGVSGAAPIWNRIIAEFLKGKKDEPFPRPEGIVEMDIDGYGGGTPVDGYTRRNEFFVKGTEPTSPSSIYQQIKVSKNDTNKLANSLEIAKGEFENRAFVVFTEQDPVSSDGKNRWQEGIDKWVTTLTDAKFRPPTETKSTTGDDITVSIKEPAENSQVNTNDVKIVLEAASTNEITKLELFVDGSLRKEVSGKNLTETVNLANGNHTIKAKVADNKGKQAEREIHIGVNQPYVAPTP